MKKYLLILLGAGLIMSASSTAKQYKYEHMLSLQLKDENAAYVFDVPESVYQNVYHSNLSDVRIVNADGDFVPMKIIYDSNEIKHEYSQTSLPTFKLKKVQSTPINTKQTRTTRAGNREDYTVETSKSMRYFLENQEIQDNSVIYIDANVLKDQKIEKLSLDWQYQTQGNRIFHVKLSGSNDLSNWQTIKSHYKLLEIKSGSKTILENNIELNQKSYLYYQLVFKDKIIPELKSVQAHLIAEFSQGKNKWNPIENVTLINDNALEFDTGGYYSLESFKLNFKQKNTLTNVTFYSRNNNKSKWHYAGSGSIYSISINGSINSRNSIKIRRSQHRYWKISLDENVKNSSVKSIQFAWRNHQIKFLAQGEAPFALVFGNRNQSRRPAIEWYSQLPKGLNFSNRVVIKDKIESDTPNIQIQKKEPESEQAKMVFWLILLFVILLLGFMAYKLVAENNEII